MSDEQIQEKKLTKTRKKLSIKKEENKNIKPVWMLGAPFKRNLLHLMEKKVEDNPENYKLEGNVLWIRSN